MIPIVIPTLIAGASALGGMFVGSQIDDAMEKPVEVVQDQSKFPWYATLAIWVIVGLVAYNIIKRTVLK